jgi:hypothetical protein
MQNMWNMFPVGCGTCVIFGPTRSVKVLCIQARLSVSQSVSQSVCLCAQAFGCHSLYQIFSDVSLSNLDLLNGSKDFSDFLHEVRDS